MCRQSSLGRRAALVAEQIYQMLDVQAAKRFRPRGKRIQLFEPMQNQVTKAGLVVGSLERVLRAIDSAVTAHPGLAMWAAELRRLQEKMYLI